jgi:hypothetical protein
MHDCPHVIGWFLELIGPPFMQDLANEGHFGSYDFQSLDAHELLDFWVH